MFRSIVILALVAGASAYQTAEDDCTDTINSFNCGLKTESSCTGVCTWVAGTGCSLNAEDQADLQEDQNSAIAVTAIASAFCAVYNSEDCYNTCAWSAENELCLIDNNVGEAALLAVDVPPGTRTLIQLTNVGSTTCGVLAADCPTTENDFCEVVENECRVKLTTWLGTFGARCGSNGAAALAALDSTVNSGANTAAPAMVIISTLVGALAIFA